MSTPDPSPRLRPPLAVPSLAARALRNPTSPCSFRRRPVRPASDRIGCAVAANDFPAMVCLLWGPGPESNRHGREAGGFYVPP